MTTVGDVRQASLRAEELLPGILDLERLEVDLFRGLSSPEDLRRVFGGQVAGHALVAAGRTAPADRAVHSLHAYLLRPGDPAAPIVHDVDRIRDGRSFATRRVIAPQHAKAIFTLSASIHIAEPGAEHQFAMPNVPAPGRSHRVGTRSPSSRSRSCHSGTSFVPVEVRDIGGPPWAVRDPAASGEREHDDLGVGGRTAARRSAAARLRRGRRQRHDAARLRAGGATAGVRRGLRDRWRGNRGQPRPRNVIPRPVPRRRLAALRPGSPRHLPWARLPPRRVVGGLSVVQEGLIGVSSRGQGR